MKKKTALITGCLGQDGSYLAEFLLLKGYRVYGMYRRTSIPNPMIEIIPKEVVLIEGDMTDQNSIEQIIQDIKPSELYNLAAQSNVGSSFKIPEYTFDVNAIGVLRVLEAVRKYSPKTKVYQASTSELFGKAMDVPQSECTPFNPVSPYGIAKLAAHYMVKNYRDAYGIFACAGIMFNHESPRRGESFVTRKIAKAVAEIKRGERKKLELGNISAMRDWGYSKEYVEAMWLMLQQKKPKDYVIATGETHSVQEFVEAAFESVGLNWTDYVRFNRGLMRPHDVDILMGDATMANEELGWYPRVKFYDLVKIMVEAEL